MPSQSGPSRNLNIAIRRMRAGQSSSVGRLWHIREVGGQGSVIQNQRYLVELIQVFQIKKLRVARVWKAELTPGSLIPQSPHFGGLPFFLTCWYRSFPPGVLTTRTLLERVGYLFQGIASLVSSSGGLPAHHLARVVGSRGLRVVSTL